MTPSETRYARSSDLRIAYRVVGNGPLDLVFVPGFVSNVDQSKDSDLYGEDIRLWSETQQPEQFPHWAALRQARATSVGLLTHSFFG